MMVISDIIMFSCLPWIRIFFNTDFYHDTKSLSSSAQYVTLQKYYSHPSSSYLLGKTTPIKLKLGLQIGGRLLIATYLDQLNYLANQHQVLGFALSFTSVSKLCKNAGPKSFCWAKLACSSNFNLQGHILSTSGVSLKQVLVCHWQALWLFLTKSQCNFIEWKTKGK
jgi:hypothetical protein